MSSDSCLLEMRRISKSYPGVKALDSVSLKVQAGTVHALMGENGAGKSTLMKCLFGISRPDSGEILINGQKVEITDPLTGLRQGVSMIHQELLPILYRSVMENLWMGRFPLRRIGPFKFIDERRMLSDTKELFAKLKMDIDPKIWVLHLPVSKVQLIEIAKAVSWNSRIIIMDEPTSSLTENEVERLFDIINRLRDQGKAIIYISHKLEEILQIADEVSIMRDGTNVGTWPAKGLDIPTIINKMVGRDLVNRFPPRENKPGDILLSVKDFTSSNPKSFKNVSFDLRRGEILGVSGLVGAQRTELMEAVFGLRGLAGGRLLIDGHECTIRRPSDAIKKKLSLLTEDRRSTGIFPILPVFDNTLAASWQHYVRRTGWLNLKRGALDVEKSINVLRTKTPSFKTLIQNLSGGNQQKVVLSRWLLTEPDILILDEPTRGIDVGAKYEIYTIIADLAKRGKGIIMISSELPEILGMSDRIMVMCAGQVTGILDGKTATQETIMRLSTQFER